MINTQTTDRIIDMTSVPSQCLTFFFLHLPIYNLEHSDSTIWWTSCQSLAVIIQLSIVLLDNVDQTFMPSVRHVLKTYYYIVMGCFNGNCLWSSWCCLEKGSVTEIEERCLHSYHGIAELDEYVAERALIILDALLQSRHNRPLIYLLFFIVSRGLFFWKD